MSGDDWQVGDLAVCVDDRINPDFGPTSLKNGRIYEVSEVGGMGTNRLFGVTRSLNFTDLRHPNGFADARFRKVKPDAHESVTECEQLLRLFGKVTA